VPRALRIVLVVLGLAVAVYGAASLTGGWLGQPPWWTTATRPDELRDFHDRQQARLETLAARARASETAAADTELQAQAVITALALDASRPGRGPYARPGREWISLGVFAAGLALATFAAWPRRAKPTPPA
jgi:hypothetical protein